MGVCLYKFHRSSHTLKIQRCFPFFIVQRCIHYVHNYRILSLLFFRVQKIQFEFILATVYYKGVIDDYSAIDAKYTVKVIMNNQLQSSNVHVHVELYPELWRYCTSTIRTSTILDVIVIILLVITGMIYFYSIFNTVKLSTVCLCANVIMACMVDRSVLKLGPG